MVSPPLSRRTWFWLCCLGLILLFIYAVKAVLLPFVVGMGLAYMLDPAADRLERAGLSRSVATACIMVGFFALIAALLSWLLPALYDQAAELTAVLPSYVQEAKMLASQKLHSLMGRLEPEQAAKASQTLSEISQEMVQSAAALITKTLKSGAALLNLLSLVVIMPIVSFYLLRDWDRITAAFYRLLPRAQEPVIREQIALIDETLAGFIRGTLNVMLLLGGFYALALSLAGMKFALLIGLMGGCLILIPYLGTMITGTTAVTVAYMQQQGMEHVALVAGIFIAGQVLEGYVLTPRMVGKRVGLHPLWLIFGMLCGATLFGFVGVLLAVPLTAVAGVLVRFALSRYIRSDYYHAPHVPASSERP